jgi:hypothetical protein
MKKLLITAVLFLLFSACAQEQKEFRISTTEDYFELFAAGFNAFEYEAHIRGVELTPKEISFVVIKMEEYHGLCVTNTSDTHSVIILDHDLPLFHLEEVMFHELAHALLGQDGHRNERFSDGRFKSIMQGEGQLLGGFYHVYREQYLDELFNFKE